MAQDDQWDDTVRDAYQRPIAAEAEARERALARLNRELATRRARGRGAWWLDPEALKIRPLVATASLIAVLAVGLWAGAWWSASRDGARVGPLRETVRPRGASRATGDAGSDPTTVTFVFRAPGATRVCLVGDFNGWDLDATPLRRAALGDVWTAQVPLPRGLHAYAFVVDGSDWSVDPSAPLAPEATFGRRNSLLVVGEGSAL
jgi:hypothetical protein